MTSGNGDGKLDAAAISKMVHIGHSMTVLLRLLLKNAMLYPEAATEAKELLAAWDAEACRLNGSTTKRLPAVVMLEHSELFDTQPAATPEPCKPSPRKSIYHSRGLLRSDEITIFARASARKKEDRIVLELNRKGRLRMAQIAKAIGSTTGAIHRLLLESASIKKERFDYRAIALSPLWSADDDDTYRFPKLFDSSGKLIQLVET